jgi:hypothetical protein
VSVIRLDLIQGERLSGRQAVRTSGWRKAFFRTSGIFKIQRPKKAWQAKKTKTGGKF